MNGKVLITIDVEDWFQVENLRKVFEPSIWDSQEYRVEKNIDRILQLLSDKDTKATFFVLGVLAKKFPNMVKKIASENHEIGSHGYSHIMLSNLSNEQIYEDLKSSKDIIENLISKKVKGFRAPVFSITDKTYYILSELGYEYDSSLYLFDLHDRYGKVDISLFDKKDGILLNHNSGIKELTMPMVKKLGKSIPWAGGGYFRLIPYYIYKNGINNFLKKNDYFMFYMHPWEIDNQQPRINEISMLNYFRHYYGLSSTYSKLESLLNDFECCKVEDIL